MKASFLCLALTLAAAPALAATHHAHEHGRAELEVAVDGQGLVIAFESPLDNLVGFEHAPKTEAQKQALAKMEATLRNFAALFKPSPLADCRVTDTRVETETEDGGHAEARAEYTLTCALPAKLEQIEVTVFNAFPNTHSISAAFATGSGQGSATLTKTKRLLTLAK